MGLLSPPASIKLGRGKIIQAAVWTFGVVLAPPGLHDYLCFQDHQEIFHVQALIAKASIERFTIGILPRRRWIDVVGIDALTIEPSA